MAATLRKEQQAANRAKILAAAKTCFGTLGYERATVRDIANTAGVSTGAIFGSWASKAEIYREIFGHPPITPEQGAALLLAAEEVLNWASSDALARAVDAVRGDTEQQEAA